MPKPETPPTVDLAVITHAITIRLPWAAAIRAGHKTVENRGRPIRDEYLGTTVAVHAGAAWSTEGGLDGRIRSWWWGPERLDRAVEATDFPAYFRKVIAGATIAGQHEAIGGPYNTCCWPWGDWSYNRPGEPAIHIEWSNIVAIDPVGPIKGKLSVPWELTPEDAEAVTGRYR